MNELKVVGNVVEDPKTQVTKNGKTLGKLRIAYNKRGKDKDDKWVDLFTNYFNVTVWENDVKLINNIKKGDKVLVLGELQLRDYTTQEGKTGVSNDINATVVAKLEKGTSV